VNDRRRVCFLPVAGKTDPGQMLRMHGLGRDGRFEVRHGVHARFFPGTRTILKYRPDILYFDWIDRYYVGRTNLITLVKILAFMIDVQLVRHVFRRPILWTVHNLHGHESGVPAARERTMLRYFARRATRLRVFSASSAERVCALLGVDQSRVVVIPEGNYVDYYPNKISRGDARARLGLPEPGLVLLWLGHIRPYKGLRELIEAFRKLGRADWRLVIAGRPYIESYAAEIAALAKDVPGVDFHPRYVPEEELQVFYNAADAVVLPFAEVENSGSLVMAMGFGKPVVAPDRGVIRERLCRQTELIYTGDDLAAALVRLAALSLERLAEIGRANLTEAKRDKWEDSARLF
jgi:beta-1,4-mannosyltransferase